VVAVLLGVAMSPSDPLHAATLGVVAAENMYADVVAQLAGPDVAVVSVLNNPAQDPHLFEVNAATVMRVAGAGLVVYNGAEYDPWMTKLLSATPGIDRRVIVAADLARKSAGDNPHFWYDPTFMPVMANAIAAALIDRDPDARAAYEARLKVFDEATAPLTAKVAAMRAKYSGVPVTATEPVFDYMARAIGLQMRNPAFQLAVMNDTEPSARDVAAFEDDLKNHKVRALLFNIQAASPLSRRMQQIAEEAKVPVVEISETEPPGMHYQDWIAAELDALDVALSGSRP